jgi:hypothetical protein
MQHVPTTNVHTFWTVQSKEERVEEQLESWRSVERGWERRVSRGVRTTIKRQFKSSKTHDFLI